MTFVDVVGQERAVEALTAAAVRPTHAYLLVGPPGTGKRAAAVAFAAALLHSDDRRIRAGMHPDVQIYERKGPYLTVDDAREINTEAHRTPVEAERKVIVVPDLHLVREAGPALLKTIEEPPGGLVFVLLADHIPSELVTIASRCVVVELSALSDRVVADRLIAEGVAPSVAEEAAAASGGRLDRARLLAGDEGFAARQALWRSLPDQLDGTGAPVAAVVDRIVAGVETILEPLRRRHQEELIHLDEMDAISGRRSGRGEIDARQKREIRRVRTDELRAGLATLAAVYRDRFAAGHADPSVFEALRDAEQAIERNPNEQLLLTALLLKIAQ